MSLSEFIKKRASVKTKVTTFHKYLSKLDEKYPSKTVDQDTLTEIEERLERFRLIIDEYDDVQQKIDQLTEDSEKELDERETFETGYFSGIRQAKSFINASCETRIVRQNNDSSSLSHREPSLQGETINVNQHIKLPVIDLPKFTGDYSNWLEFRDTFDSLIHKNSSINEIQKFHYLRASLVSEASQIIASLEFSSSNYTVAWELVCNRYNNVRILTQNHVKALFTTEKITEESSRAIRRLVDNVPKHLRALALLKEPVEKWDTLIIYLVSTKLDDTTFREWEQKKASFEKPSLDNLLNFLKERADLLESLESQTKSNKYSKLKTKYESTSNNKSFVVSSASCSFCKGNHYIQDCQEFIKLRIDDRLEKIKKTKLCINCLRPGHMIKQCRSSSCKRCKGRHHTLLHIQSENDSPKDSKPSSSDRVSLSTLIIPTDSQVILSTVLVKILSNNNTYHEARALLDSGSQSSFITLDLCKRLGLQTSNIDMNIAGLNHVHSKINCKTNVIIQARKSNFSLKTECLVIDQITNNLPNFEINTHSLRIPANITLADPIFNVPGKIDLLIGADCFWQLLCVGQIKLFRNGPILQKTKFGWIISGPIPGISSNKLCHFSSNLDIDKQLEKFWQVEELPTSKSLSKEEKACELHFLDTVKRNGEGRFIVKIPLKQCPDKLGDSFEIAKKRFLNLERKFRNNPDLKIQYQQFIDEYRDLGHMFRISNEYDCQYSYYMPHHGVIKESSSTTRLRVVFDASCPTSTGISFNDLQMVGPTIQSDLLSILIRFRKHTYVVSGDIEKMYRMCLIDKSQRSLQRILWRDNEDQPLEIYELATVTYGTSSAPYLAVRCLYQLGLECDSPLVSHVIKNDFYVDDLLTGGENEQEVSHTAREICRVLQGGGFKLRKWISNSEKILSDIGEHGEVNNFDFGANENTKTLGLLWNSRSDTLLYKINSNLNRTPRITKRTMLSDVSQIFDPMGLLSPSIICAKILLQELWREKLSWDESLPSHIHTKWLQIRDELHLLNDLKIPRQITCRHPNLIEIHGFADASSQAYGSCVYIKSQNKCGETCVRLICSKSKVAPLKTQTIPRLELMAALLLTNLVEKVQNSLDLAKEEITYWSDSTIVLGWLTTSPNMLQTFVGNRVARIQEMSDASQWKYVPTKDNPADCVSRGVKPGILRSLDLYWNGPSWLCQNYKFWPVSPIEERPLPELKETINVYKCQTDFVSFPFEKYSNLSRLERIIAFCLRFKLNCFSPKADRKCGPLTSLELKNALHCLIKISQRESFCNLLNDLRQNRLTNSKEFIKLNPFLDESGIARVGGRLSNSNFNYDKKHPVLLNSKHYFTKMLFVKYHEKLMHAGPQLLLYTIRERFWPLSGRDLARRTVHACMKCFRAKPRMMNPIMGNLPHSRVTPSPPFFCCGVDYAGPFLIKDRIGRGCKVTKCYISLFICFTTRAMHIELVSDLTKDAFIAAFRRFVARRGKPAQMYSDNGSTFIGANSELHRLGEFLILNADELSNTIENAGIRWSFIPAHSPHFGGLWEAGVKSVKHHLHRVAGNALLTFEQFYTLLVQIESILNSRPISPLSSDPSDLTPLSPAHFIIGRTLTSAADPDVTEVPENRLTHFQRIQQMKQHFWIRWSREYISELQQRQKWFSHQRTLKLNDLVVIKEDNQHPLKWSLGRITALHPGRDGVARVVTIKTAGGDVRRSVAKICPLPLDTVSEETPQ